MKDFLNFSGKRAIVTGGRRGLGRAMATALAERGCSVAVVSHSREADGLLAELNAFGGKHFYFPADLGNREARRGLIAKMAETLGGLDILVNNAGLQFDETIETCTEEHWEISRSLMLDAVYDLSRQAIPFLKTAGGGKIINIASICAFREGGWNFSYGVMKTGIMGMTRCMANILARDNINVNAIAPGITRTDLTEHCFNPSEYKIHVSKYPAGRLGEPEEIANVMLFLASDMSSFVNGVTLPVDGAFTGN